MLFSFGSLGRLDKRYASQNDSLELKVHFSCVTHLDARYFSNYDLFYSLALSFRGLIQLWGSLSKLDSFACRVLFHWGTRLMVKVLFLHGLVGKQGSLLFVTRSGKRFSSSLKARSNLRYSQGKAHSLLRYSKFSRLFHSVQRESQADLN